MSDQTTGVCAPKWVSPVTLQVTLTLVHRALQQSGAGAAPLDQSDRVCLLMHVGVAQASTPLWEHPNCPSATVSTILLLRLRLDQDFPIAASIFQRILGLFFAPKVCTPTHTHTNTHTHTHTHTQTHTNTHTVCRYILSVKSSLHELL
jgi:hypothetical protein